MLNTKTEQIVLFKPTPTSCTNSTKATLDFFLEPPLPSLKDTCMRCDSVKIEKSKQFEDYYIRQDAITFLIVTFFFTCDNCKNPIIIN